MAILDNLWCIVLPEPIRTFDKAFTQELFTKTMALKIRGYEFEHGPGVLPVDNYDYVGTAVIYAEREGDKFIPVQAVRHCTWEQAEKYNLEFQPLTAVNGENREALIKDISAYRDRFKEKKNVSYDSAWTIEPKYRGTRKGAKLIQGMFALWYLHHRDYGIEGSMTSGLLKLKTEEFFQKCGCIPVNDNPFFKQRAVKNADAIMLKLDKWSGYILKLAEEWEAFWNKRIVIDEAYYSSNS